HPLASGAPRQACPRSGAGLLAAVSKASPRWPRRRRGDFLCACHRLEPADGFDLAPVLGRPFLDELARNVDVAVMRPSGGGALKDLAGTETQPEVGFLRAIELSTPFVLELGFLRFAE